MKKKSAAKRSDALRPEYDLSQLKGGRGKYYRRAAAGTNLVLIEPDLANLFPGAEAVNRALRVLAEAAQSAATSKRRRALSGARGPLRDAPAESHPFKSHRSREEKPNHADEESPSQEVLSCASVLSLWA